MRQMASNAAIPRNKLEFATETMFDNIRASRKAMTGVVSPIAEFKRTLKHKSHLSLSI
jgi:hypothetical protein